jgi:hypothetical protein
MDHFDEVVTYSGADYRCYPTSLRDNQLRNRGQTFRENYTESIIIVGADVSISSGDKVTRNGTVRRVLEVDTDADGIQEILHLGKEFGAR